MTTVFASSFAASLSGGHILSSVEVGSGLLALGDIHRAGVGHSGQLAREQKKLRA